jgi:hypothetical protein
MDPVQSQYHLNVPLSNFAVRFDPPDKPKGPGRGPWFDWREILPTQVVNHRSDYFRRINPDNMMRRESGLVGEGGVRSITRVNMSLDPSQLFYCQDYAFEAILPKSTTGNADPSLQVEIETLKTLRLKMSIDWQVKLDTEVLRRSPFGIPIVTLSGGDQFDADSPTSDPVNVLRAACDDVEKATGRRPNIIKMALDSWRAIQNNPRVKERAPVHPTGEGIFTPEMFAKALEVEPEAIRITSFTFNVAPENQTIARRAPMGPDVFIGYMEPPSLSHFGLGTTFMWAGDAAEEMEKIAETDPGLKSPIAVYSFFDPNADTRGGYVYRAVGALDFKITNPRAGKIIVNAVNAGNPAYGGTLNLLFQ